MAKFHETDSNELLPPEGHKDVGYSVFAILDEIVQDKKELKLTDKWQRFYELGKNKHWRSDNSALSLTSANLLFTHRRRTVNLLTDNNPTFNVKRVMVNEENEDSFIKTLRATEYWWGETEQQQVFEESVFNGETYGVCIEKLRFNVDLEYGLGDVETEVVDPHHFGFYPVKARKLKKAEAVAHYYPISVRQAKRMFPEFADKIVADKQYFDQLGEDRRGVNNLKNEGSSSSNNNKTSFGGVIRNLLSGTATEKGDDDELLLVEMWVKDYTVDKDDIPIYPGNIRVVTVVNGHIVVSDKKNPSVNPNLSPELARMTYLYDKFPFIMENSHTDTINPWGSSDFEQLMHLQLEINKSLSQFNTIKDKVAGAKVINPLTSGVPNSQMANGVGVINPTNANHGVGWMKSPDVPKEILESLKIYQELFFLVSGSFDLENASTPGKQVIAYKAIAALIERASTMLRGKIRNYSRLIRERGRMYISMMNNWYTEERYFSYDSDGDSESDIIKGTDVIVPLKLTVVSGSTMPRSQVQQREEAIELFSKNAIDIEELLKTMDWPKWKEVAARMQGGPVQSLTQKLAVAGTPDEIIQYIEGIGNLDEKKVMRGIERNEIPVFTNVFDIQGFEDPVKEIELTLKTKEVETVDANLEKISKEIEKLDEEIVAIPRGLKIKEDQVKIDRAKVLSDRDKENKSKLEVVR